MNPAPSTSPARPLEPPRPTDLEQLGERIAQLAAQITAATFQLLNLIREFDQREGWNSVAYGGFRTCAHWLSWRTGLALGPAREKVRVARALGRLPEIAEAMRRAEISYSKVRALTRVATPDNEAELLAFARAGTASHVERLVRAWRRADRLEEGEHEARCHASRYLSLWTDEDGMVAVRGRLDPEAGMALMKAVEAAADVLYDRQKEADTAADTAAGAGVPPAQRRADALGRVAEAALAGGLDRGTRGDRYQVVLHVDAPVLAAPVLAAPVLPAPVQAAPVPAELSAADVPAGTPREGAGQVDRDGAEQAGLPAAVRRGDVPAGTSENGTAFPAELAPPSRPGVPAGTSKDGAGLGVGKSVEPGRVPAAPGPGNVPAGTPEHSGAPATSSCGDVPAGTPPETPGSAAAFQGEVPLSSRPDVPAGTPGTNLDRFTASAAPNPGNVPAGTPRDHPEPREQSAFEGGGYVPAETSRRIACDSSLVTMTHDAAGGILDVGRRTRTVPPALRRALTHRDRGCRFPGCGLEFCDAHHLRHWAEGGETSLDNLVLLCRRHHRCVHEEGYRVRSGPGGELRFFRPDGRPIPEAPPLPALADRALASLADSLTEAGVGVEELGGFPEWDGGAVDLAWAVDAMRSSAGAEF